MFTILLILGVEKIFGKQGASEKGILTFKQRIEKLLHICIGG